MKERKREERGSLSILLSFQVMVNGGRQFKIKTENKETGGPDAMMPWQKPIFDKVISFCL